MKIIKLNHKPVSSFIEQIEYSYFLGFVKTSHNKLRLSELITVKFKDGSCIEYKPNMLTTQYFEVFYNQFISAPSVGKFWHKEIKDKLEWKRIR